MLVKKKQQQIAVASLAYRRSERDAIWPRWCAGHFLSGRFHVVASSTGGLAVVREMAQKNADKNQRNLYIADVRSQTAPITEEITYTITVESRPRRVARRRTV